jgi:hypothetical protein
VAVAVNLEEIADRNPADGEPVGFVTPGVGLAS